VIALASISIAVALLCAFGWRLERIMRLGVEDDLKDCRATRDGLMGALEAKNRREALAHPGPDADVKGTKR
jgi:hypothetical protein